VQQVFRFEPGEREREEWQCGIELLGSGDVDADAEVLTVLLEALDALGLAPTVRASHTGLLRALFESASADRETVIDLQEAARHEGLGALQRLPDADGAIGTVLGLLERVDSPGFLRGVQPALKAHLPAVEPAVAMLLRFAEALEGRAEVKPDPSLLRDFEYYTGVVFEIEVGGEPVGAGGEYDGVYELLTGSSLPATGGVLYMDRLAAMLAPDSWPNDGVPVRGESLALRRELRARGRRLRSAAPGELALELRTDGLALSTGGLEAQSVADIDEALAVLRVVS
jgi:histidyl-tRNA synthetase